jgi:hypothetical protein
LFLQQPDLQALGSFGIAAGLNYPVKTVTVLVNGAPKSMFSAADGNHHLIQVPDIFSVTASYWVID